MNSVLVWENPHLHLIKVYVYSHIYESYLCWMWSSTGMAWENPRLLSPSWTLNSCQSHPRCRSHIRTSHCRPQQMRLWQVTHFTCSSCTCHATWLNINMLTIALMLLIKTLMSAVMGDTSTSQHTKIFSGWSSCCKFYQHNYNSLWFLFI